MSLARQAIIAASLAAIASTGAAQQYPSPSPAVTVYERTRDFFEPKGFSIGDGIILRPSMGVREFYDSNVFYTEDNRKDDFVTQYVPGLRLDVLRPTFEISASAEAAISRFTTMDSQDTEEWNASLGGLYRFSPFDVVRASFLDRRIQVSRSDPEEGGGSGKPNMADVLSGEAAYTRDEGPYHGRVGTIIRHWNYLTSTQNDRDRMDYVTTGRLGYDLTPIVRPYVDLIYAAKDYDKAAFFSDGINHDTQRVTGLVGAQWKLADLWTVDVAAGGGELMFSDSRLSDKAVWTARATAGYNITPSLTLKAGLSRDELDSTSQGTSTRTSEGGNVGFEYAMLSNVVMYGDFAYRYTDYHGNPRRDDDYSYGIGARYFVNSNVSLFAEYDLNTRESNLAGGDFTHNLIWVGVQAGF